MKRKLKPCPFCGVTGEWEDSHENYYFEHKNGCFFQFRDANYIISPHERGEIAAWNRRGRGSYDRR